MSINSVRRFTTRPCAAIRGHAARVYLLVVAVTLCGCSHSASDAPVLPQGPAAPSSQDAQEAALALMRMSQLPTGWSQASASVASSLASIRTGGGCQSTALLDQVTAQAQVEFFYDLSPRGLWSGDLAETVDALATAGDAQRMHAAVSSAEYWTCRARQITPIRVVAEPVPADQPQISDAPLAIGKDPNQSVVRYELRYPDRDAEPTTYADVLDVIGGRFRAYAVLVVCCQAPAITEDKIVLEEMASRLASASASSSATGTAIGDFGLPTSTPPNTVGSFTGADTSFFDLPEVQGGSDTPIPWAPENGDGSSLDPQANGDVVERVTTVTDGAWWDVPVSTAYAFTQLDANLVGTTGSNTWAGLGCAIPSGDQQLDFLIGDGGRWQVSRYLASNKLLYVRLASGTSTAIHPLGSRNHISVACSSTLERHDQLAMAVNDQLLAVFSVDYTDLTWQPILDVATGAPVTIRFSDVVQSALKG